MQEDVTTIDHWISHNFFTLNKTKCKQMVITRSRTHQCTQLYLASHPLEHVHSYKYLGVIITSWSEHIQSICNKSGQLVGLLYHQIYLNADSDTLHQFYLSCIRPHLELCVHSMGPLPGKRESPSGGSTKVCLQSML